MGGSVGATGLRRTGLAGSASIAGSGFADDVGVALPAGRVAGFAGGAGTAAAASRGTARRARPFVTPLAVAGAGVDSAFGRVVSRVAVGGGVARRAVDGSGAGGASSAGAGAGAGLDRLIRASELPGESPRDASLPGGRPMVAGPATSGGSSGSGPDGTG